MVKKTINIIAMVVLAISMIIMVGCSSSSSGDKFLGKWQDTSDSKTVMTIEYLDSKHKVLKISAADQTLTGTLQDGIIKLDSIANYTMFINSDKSLEIAGGYKKAIYKKIK